MADGRGAVYVASGRPRGTRSTKPAAGASYRAWIRASVLWLLLLTGAGIASALFAPEAASFVVGKLVSGEGGDIAERIRSRL